MTPRNAATALATTVVDELVRSGLRHLVLSPGSRSAALAFAAHRAADEGQLTLHTRLDERTAAFLALGLALAAALPELPYACGLATVQLLTDDVVAAPLLPVDGMLPVGLPTVAPEALVRLAASPERVAHWEARRREVEDLRRSLRQDHRS